MTSGLLDKYFLIYIEKEAKNMLKRIYETVTDPDIFFSVAALIAYLFLLWALIITG